MLILSLDVHFDMTVDDCVRNLWNDIRVKFEVDDWDSSQDPGTIMQMLSDEEQQKKSSCTKVKENLNQFSFVMIIGSLAVLAVLIVAYYCKTEYTIYEAAKRYHLYYGNTGNSAQAWGRGSSGTTRSGTTAVPSGSSGSTASTHSSWYNGWFTSQQKAESTRTRRARPGHMLTGI